MWMYWFMQSKAMFYQSTDWQLQLIWFVVSW